MKRKVIGMAVFIVIFLCNAVAEAGKNTFMSGITPLTSWACGNGNMIYWLKSEDEMMPANLYTMSFLDSQVTCLLEGDSNTWFSSILDAGDSLLLSVSKNLGDTNEQIIRISYDASEAHIIAETTSFGLYIDGMLYYGDHASICEMDLSTEKSRVIYSSNNPNCMISIEQYANDCLYFYEDEDVLHEFSIKKSTARELLTFSGSFFVDKDFIFFSDFDKNSTFIMNLSNMEVIESRIGSYFFSQGYENRILAYDINNYRDQNFVGEIYRIEYLENGSVKVKQVGNYHVDSEIVIDGRLYSYHHLDNKFVEIEW